MRLIKAIDVEVGDTIKWHGEWLTVAGLCGLPGEDGCFRFTNGTESTPFSASWNEAIGTHHRVAGCWVEVRRSLYLRKLRETPPPVDW